VQLDKSERMNKGKLNIQKVVQCSSIYTRIWYTLTLVNFDRFFQQSNITDLGEKICIMVIVRGECKLRLTGLHYSYSL